MPQVRFTPNLRRHLVVETAEVDAATVSEALEAVFSRNPALRSYLLDDQGRVRTHVAVYVDGSPLRDRVRLADPLRAESEVQVMQALSGG